jgi:hypothetical protein
MEKTIASQSGCFGKGSTPLYGVSYSNSRSLVSLDPTNGNTASFYTFPVANTTVLS